jgi:cytosine/adenosine deaminase-related metal-dependent hydrolase
MLSALDAPALRGPPHAQPLHQGLSADLWPQFKARVTACYQAPSRAIARELASGIQTGRHRMTERDWTPSASHDRTRLAGRHDTPTATAHALLYLI